MAVGQRQVAPAPAAANSERFVGGLIVSANRPTAPDRWENGITYEPECVGDDPDPHAIECGGETFGTTGQDPSAVVEWDAYGLHKTYRCSTLAARGKDWRALALRRLQRASDRMLGRELWRGTKARAESYPNRFLASNDSDEVTDGATSPTDALACLQQALGGEVGMIHAPIQVVTHWSALNLLERDGLTLRTQMGHFVVGSEGYDGSGPDAEGAGQGTPVAVAEGSMWAYATGIVDVRLGEILVIGNPLGTPEQVDRSGSGTSNRGLVVAHRAALASWDLCRHYAAELDMSLCNVGGAS